MPIDTTDTGSLASSELGPMEVDDLLKSIDRDRGLAVGVDKAAGAALNSTSVTEFASDITGDPKGAQAFNRWKREEIRGLQTMSTSHFFARIDTLLTDRDGEDQPQALLVSRARGVSGKIYGDGWQLVSWTSPVSSLVLDKSFGHEATYQALGRRRTVTWKVQASAKFDELLPELKDAQYTLASGVVFVPNETMLQRMISDCDEADLVELPASAPLVEYEAAETFGLGDIIVLADAPQREAMLLPFGSHVLVEGPPGSGKTSIGIMRIACLIDQQWDELELDKQKDKPFHKPSSMRMLVFGNEMVQYLTTLLRSIGVEGVPVQTTAQFLRQVCREADTLSGREAPDQVRYMARVKGRRQMLDAYWAGFRKHLISLWQNESSGLLKSLSEISQDMAGAHRVIESWVGRVREAILDEVTLDKPVNISESLTRWASQHSGSLDENASTQKHLREARDCIQKFLRKALERRMIVRSMFDTQAYADLLRSATEMGEDAKTIAKADARWRKQYEGESPSYSEYDAMAAAWLGIKVSLVGSDKAPFVGGRVERLTHLVIDEAQDLSPCHIATLESLLAKNGTMTLAGDLHQSLAPGVGLQKWEELGIADIDRRVFDINYRQSFQLGGFVHELHRRLFAEEPVWRPSNKWHGPLPTVSRTRSWDAAAYAAAREARRWRTEFPRATVGVLYDSKPPLQTLGEIKDIIEGELADILTSVVLVQPGGRSAQLGETDCVIVASVESTKGLEFDAVVYIDPSTRWSPELDGVELRAKNGLYVACTRAKQCLSIILGVNTEWLSELAESGFCQLTEADEPVEN